MQQIQGVTNTTKFLRLPQVMQQTGLGRSSIYKLIHEGGFPKQIKLTGARAVAWLESDVQGWINDRIAVASEGGAA